MIDSHTHLNLSPLSEDIPAILARAEAAGITHCIVPGTTANDSASSVDISELFDTVYAAIGVHPDEAGSYGEVEREKIKELLGETNKVVSIGEVGLDYYRLEGSEEEMQAVKQRQQALFKEMIELAVGHGLPLVIHCRDAFADCHRMLKELAPNHPTVIHCFTGTMDEAKGWLESGCLISFTGIITYKKNDELREVVKMVPLDRMLLETDSPFLAPEGFRGKVCEPMYVRQVAECVAEVKGISVDEVDSVTAATTMEFFGL